MRSIVLKTVLVQMQKIVNLSPSSVGLNESRYSDVANSSQKAIGNLSRSAGTRRRDDLKYFVLVSRYACESLAQRGIPTRKAIVLLSEWRGTRNISYQDNTLYIDFCFI